jgi:hypothetical protein
MGRDFWACPTDDSHVESAAAMFARAYKRDLEAGRWLDPGRCGFGGPGDAEWPVGSHESYMNKCLERNQ